MRSVTAVADLWCCSMQVLILIRVVLITVCVLSVLLLFGCGKRQVYEGLQSRQRFECHRVPQSEIEECLDRASVSYDEYQQRIDELKEDK